MREFLPRDDPMFLPVLLAIGVGLMTAVVIFAASNFVQDELALLIGVAFLAVGYFAINYFGFIGA